MKLYWRIKRNGKWTWVAATESNTREDDDEEMMELITALRYVGEEE